MSYALTHSATAPPHRAPTTTNVARLTPFWSWNNDGCSSPSHNTGLWYSRRTACRIHTAARGTGRHSYQCLDTGASSAKHNTMVLVYYLVGGHSINIFFGKMALTHNANNIEIYTFVTGFFLGNLTPPPPTVLRNTLMAPSSRTPVLGIRHSSPTFRKNLMTSIQNCLCLVNPRQYINPLSRVPVSQKRITIPVCLRAWASNDL